MEVLNTLKLLYIHLVRSGPDFSFPNYSFSTSVLGGSFPTHRPPRSREPKDLGETLVVRSVTSRSR